ncbi:MAG: AAA family ATPase [Acidimicrobiia bacterium]|nr:AAA family ATPase [Acidimicrobiia bacterium]NNL68473.1 AAA family ATPase [Acidimicrobiia bacterium]
MDNTADLRVLLGSRHPLLFIEAQDESRLLRLLRDSAWDLDIPVWTWTATQGLARDEKDAQYGTRDPARALEWITYLDQPAVFVFADIHAHLGDARVVRAIKDLAQAARPGQTLVLTAPSRDIPAELEGLALPWNLQPPGEEELRRLITRTIDDLVSRRFTVELDDADVEQLAAAVRGVSLREAESLIQQAAFRDGSLTGADLATVRRAKAEMLSADGVLELVEAEVGTLDQVGGLDGLKEWLRVRRAAEQHGAMEAARGILLTGIPGCGKSFVAKTLARTWELPLVLLDPSRLYRPYIGETEQRLDAALTSINALAPAVLWIDEIEKGFAAGGTSDSGVSQRLLGTFLRWMQEREPGVFLIATANDVSQLPPELLRKGRFDEIFFVDLPNAGARREIFRLHLSKRDVELSDLEIGQLVRSSAGFSGAEIEAAVVGGLYRAFGSDRAIGATEVAAEVAATVPLSVSRAETVQRLRSWATERAVAA